jgi:isopentenyldiphosphate isomerase
MIVVTQDDKVLLTKRSKKVEFYPETWSCSVEEQLSTDDFLPTEQSPIMNWARRCLKEELGLGGEEYDVSNLRVLSVFLESDVLGVDLCAHAVLNIHSSELNKILQALPRTDYEFTEWTFASHEELMGELFQPRREYHPTSGYRILMGLLRRYGEPKVAEMFVYRS